MATANYNLPLLTSDSPIQFVQDYNALATATDSALATVGGVSGLEAVKKRVTALETAVNTLQTTLNEYKAYSTYGQIDGNYLIGKEK